MVPANTLVFVVLELQNIDESVPSSCRVYLDGAEPCGIGSHGLRAAGYLWEVPLVPRDKLG